MKRIKTKSILLILTCALLQSVLSGCYDRREIDDLAYVMAVGFDKGKTNALRMTLQIAVPTEIGGGGGGGDGSGGGSDGNGGTEGSTIMVLEAPTIYTGLNMANSFIGKELNMSHAKAVIFSKELAQEGIHKYIRAIVRGREFRPNLFVVVSRTDAEDYIRNVTPQLEINPAKYYELIFRNYRYTGFTANSQLINFYLEAESESGQAVAILAGVSEYESMEDIKLDNSTFSEKGRESPLEGDYKAGEIPKVGDLRSEIMGVAVFDGGTMVGELDGESTSYLLMARGELAEAYFSIPDPEIEDLYVVLNIQQNKQPVRKVTIMDGIPSIELQVKLEADIMSIQSGINYEMPEKSKILEKAAEEFIKEGIMRYLETTAELGADTSMFGNEVKKKFLTWQEWEEINWLGMYGKSKFNVDVKLSIRRPGLVVKSIPAQSTEGEETY